LQTFLFLYLPADTLFASNINFPLSVNDTILLLSHSTFPTIAIMSIPSYGAAPLSTTFLMVRVMQVVSLIVILGLTGNFINEMVMANLVPSREIVGTISVVCT
jgi:hypothetical protein